jgi:alanine-synthesizing transaminase
VVEGRMKEFERIKQLPPYIFNIVNQLKIEARARGEDIVDLGMGNPDLPTPPHIVAKLCEAAQNPRNHRYSVSRGLSKLRIAISDWYKRRYQVEVDPETQVIATLGAKEGIAHLVLALLEPGAVVLVPTPTYPIHHYSVVIAGGTIKRIRIGPDEDFLHNLRSCIKESWPPPKLLILSFPHNPTTSCVDLSFFKHVVSVAREHQLLVIHDFAYADLTFDGYLAPSLLAVDGATELGVEFFTLSKSYSMAGWRVSFAVGSAPLISALARVKSYLDYGIFQPIQIAAIDALNGPQECVQQTVATYRSRRDVLVEGLNRLGWTVDTPQGTMFVWARIPPPYQAMGSLEFAKFLLQKAKVAVAPGIGFGDYGDEHVRFALVENAHRIRQALQGIKRAL